MAKNFSSNWVKIKDRPLTQAEKNRIEVKELLAITKKMLKEYGYRKAHGIGKLNYIGAEDILRTGKTRGHNGNRNE